MKIHDIGLAIEVNNGPKVSDHYIDEHNSNVFYSTRRWKSNDCCVPTTFRPNNRAIEYQCHILSTSCLEPRRLS